MMPGDQHDGEGHEAPGVSEGHHPDPLSQSIQRCFASSTSLDSSALLALQQGNMGESVSMMHVPPEVRQSTISSNLDDRLFGDSSVMGTSDGKKAAHTAHHRYRQERGQRGSRSSGGGVRNTVSMKIEVRQNAASIEKIRQHDIFPVDETVRKLVLRDDASFEMRVHEDTGLVTMQKMTAHQPAQFMVLDATKSLPKKLLNEGSLYVYLAQNEKCLTVDLNEKHGAIRLQPFHFIASSSLATQADADGLPDQLVRFGVNEINIEGTFGVLGHIGFRTVPIADPRGIVAAAVAIIATVPGAHRH